MRFDWFIIALWILGGVGVGSIILREINFGVSVSEDAALYIASARYLIEGEGFINLYGSPYVTSPPLFPLAIAAVSALGIDAVTAAIYVNAIVFGLTILVATIWLRRHIESRLLVLWAGCACVLSVLVARSAATVMTDSLFILLVVLSLAALDRFVNSYKRSALTLAAIWTGLAWLTRYIGVTVLLAGWLILLMQKDISVKQKRRNFIIYSAVAMAPIGVWIFRNSVVAQSLTGRPVQDGFLLLSSLDNIQTILVQWAFGDTGFEYLNELSKDKLNISILQNPTITAILLKASVLFMVCIVVGFGVVYLIRKGYLQNRKTLVISGIFIVVYALGLAITLPTANINFADRFLAPIHVPILVAVTLIIRDCLRWISPHLPAKLLLGFLGLWLISQIQTTYNDIRNWLDFGGLYSFTSPYRADSEVINYIKSNPLDGLIYSNDSEFIYMITDPPNPFYYIGLPADPTELDFAAQRGGGWHSRKWLTNGDIADAYMVVFYARMSWINELEDLAELPGIEVLAVLEDGAILKRPKGTDSRSRQTIFDVALEDSELVARSDFDIYIKEDENRLVYIKDECDEETTVPLFFLHIDPVDQIDLPEHRRQHRFDNLDFIYNKYGFRIGERCIIQRNLPDYDMTAIRTGQWIDGQGKLWEVGIRP